ncbi:hypothetical protein [Paenibacillus apiarius]|uniref:hypothetical protein n=1 Tax=Paenibacillus apiarius TaxID=46240 RepID=UPI003B3A6DE8
MAKPRINRKDWRNLAYVDWNVHTVHAYFADMNRELFGVTEYLPMRNWRFEQGRIKQALNEHGAELLHRAFDECFRTYGPTREYPLLTAGFAISYRINGIIPKLQAEMGQAQEDEEAPLDYAELANWL